MNSKQFRELENAAFEWAEKTGDTIADAQAIVRNQAVLVAALKLPVLTAYVATAEDRENDRKIEAWKAQQRESDRKVICARLAAEQRQRAADCAAAYAEPKRPRPAIDLAAIPDAPF